MLRKSLSFLSGLTLLLIKKTNHQKMIKIDGDDGYSTEGDHNVNQLLQDLEMSSSESEPDSGDSGYTL